MKKLTAAHRSLPFGTRVKVTHRKSGRSVIVRINDRGPQSKKRVIDLSKAAAERLGIIREGVAPVRLSVLNRPKAKRKREPKGKPKAETKQSSGPKNLDELSPVERRIIEASRRKDGPAALQALSDALAEEIP